MMFRKLISGNIIFMYLCGIVSSKKDCSSNNCVQIPNTPQRVNVGNYFKQDLGPIMPIEDYIRQFGYPVESHEITTEDGYILTYHRIPHGKGPSENSTIRPPVLVQHGLFSDSPVWVMTENSLGFSLADAGFDVWLGNSRGNTYSRKHFKYDPEKDKEAFWDFSWHEMGYYDLPASIDYILETTDNEKLFYIGHSMGTTMYFVLGATRPEYMKKVRAMAAMAPVAYITNIHSPFANYLDKFQKMLNWIFKKLGVYEIWEYSNHTYWLDAHLCAKEHLQFICRDLIFSICGYDEKELNRTVLPILLEYLPAGASYKTLIHYSQVRKKDGGFKQFDYGHIGNMWRYGTLTPPLYNLDKVTSPLCIYYGLNDWVAVPQDVNYTMAHLPNVQRVYKVPDAQFNHIDFMWAIDAKTLVYDDIISIFLDFIREK